VTRLPIALAFAGGVIAAAGGYALWPAQTTEPTSNELMDALMWNKGPIGGPFTLVDQDGKSRTDADFRGRLLLIYFGFTFCSDACPTELQSMAQAIDRLGPAGEAIQPLFITVDPQMDTPAALKSYVGLFHPRLIGLTGDPREIRKVALSYKVYYDKTDPTRRDGTQVDHSGAVYVVGRDGKYLGFAPPGTSADRLIALLRPYLTAPAQS
jgi:cytochrome oxidase Cu insertion factor (SCO1/SenC/PrrC family)